MNKKNRIENRKNQGRRFLLVCDIVMFIQMVGGAHVQRTWADPTQDTQNRGSPTPIPQK